MALAELARRLGLALAAANHALMRGERAGIRQRWPLDENIIELIKDVPHRRIP
jgi:hypothetical protein